jgi:hypothetical protein
MHKEDTKCIKRIECLECLERIERSESIEGLAPRERACRVYRRSSGKRVLGAIQQRMAADSSQNSDSHHPILPGQNLSLYSGSSGRRQFVRAIFRPNIPDNFIARRIAQRLELKMHSNCSVVKAVVWGQTPIPPTSDYVDLACYAEGTNCVTYRFYVVKHCSFDLLFGSDSISSYS